MKRGKSMAKCYGQKLNFIAVSIANAIAEGLSDEELDLLSTLLQLVGEALAVIPAVNSVCDKQSAEIGRAHV